MTADSLKTAERLPAQSVKERARNNSSGSPRQQELCEQLFRSGDMLACYVIDMQGYARGVCYGDMEVDEELKERFAAIASVIWGGLTKVEPLGGPMTMVSAGFENFRILGIPFPLLNIGILAVVPPTSDPIAVKAQVTEGVHRWESGKGIQDGLFRGFQVVEMK